MEPIQNLYYVLGEVTYAISQAQGNIKNKEKKKLKYILVEEFDKKDINFDPAVIIFHVFEKDSMDATIAYNWAIKEMKLNRHFVTEEIKQHFVHVLKRVEKEFPLATSKDLFLLDNFINEIMTIKDNHVFEKV